MKKVKSSIYNEEYTDTFNLEPKNKEVFINTVITSASRFDDYGVIEKDMIRPASKIEDLKSNYDPFKPRGEWVSDNKTDTINLDSVDNKTISKKENKEKITPVEIKITPLEDRSTASINKKDNKFNEVYVNRDFYLKSLHCLNNYKSLILSNLSRLSKYRNSDSKEILELSKNLVEVDEVVDLLRETFRPSKGFDVLDCDDKKSDATIAHIEGDPRDFAYHNRIDSRFLTDQLKKAMQLSKIDKKALNNALGTNTYKEDMKEN